MKTSTTLLLSLALATAAAASTNDASACGGCFVQQSENTQVSGHRMILSVSPEATTLWDQITYSGNPQSFAWVLPIHGTVEIGLSSDALFEVLDQTTQVTVSSPQITCPNSCQSAGGSGDFAGAGGGGGSNGGVDVLVQEVVGPYETVQLSAQDPAALATWLSSHGYNVPADVQPVIDEYVSEQYNFLALKLVPGQGINAMRPVRITTAGASPTLPLRMVAAGTGAVTPINLWVFGDGRYEPSNFPSFTISAEEVVWNWNTSSSSYAALRQAKYDASNGFGWLVEDAETMYPWWIGDALLYGDAFDSYADADGSNAQQNLDADMADLYGNLGDDDEFFVTRLTAQLTRPALANDLQLGAAADQSFVDNYLETTVTIGTPPECPPDPCAENGGGGNGGSGGGNGNGGAGAGIPGMPGNGSTGSGDYFEGGKGSCNAGGNSHGNGGAGLALIGLGLAIAAGAARRRRDRA